MTNPFVAPDLTAPPLSYIVDSPIGRLLLTSDGHALTELTMIDAAKHAGRHETGFTPSPEAFGEVAAQLEAYFAGDLKEVTVSAGRLDGADQDPVREHGQLRRRRPRARQAPGRLPGGGSGQRGQPDRRHRALPPGDRQRRQPHRLRRRPGTQGTAAPPRRRGRPHLVVAASLPCAYWVAWGSCPPCCCSPSRSACPTSPPRSG